jgi:putative CocE/NonD family hydrolase
VFVLVDVRGRGSSEGRFTPFDQEANDGYDIVEWLAKQPFCDGKVTMWGGSYAGYDQWATAKKFPPHLKTIVPVAAVYPGLDFPMRANISYPYVMQWLTFTSGSTGNANLFGESSFWNSKALDIYLNGLPFNTLDKLVGNDSTVFQTFMQHPRRDAFWDSMVPTDSDYSKMGLPILTITGHYDGDQPGAMEFYKRLEKNSSSAARQNHYLIVGPYDHAGTRTPKREMGGLVFGEKSLLDMNKLQTGTTGP